MLLNIRNCKERIIKELKDYGFKYNVNGDDIIVRLDDNSSHDYVVSIDIPRNKLFRTRKRDDVLNMFKDYDIQCSAIPVRSLANFYSERVIDYFEIIESEVKEFQTVEELMVDLKSFKVQLEV